MDCTTIEKLAAVGLATALLGLAGAGGAAAADFVARDDEIIVSPDHEAQIPAGLLLANDDLGISPNAIVIAGHSLPFHGELEDFTYTPGDDFWTAGSDSFTYTIGYATDPGGETSTATVFLIAGFHSEVWFDVDFESDLGELGPPFTGDDIEVTEEAAISGEKGLRVGVTAFQPEAYMSLTAQHPIHSGHGGEEIKILEPQGVLPIGSSAKVISGGSIGAEAFTETFAVTLHKDRQGELGVLVEMMDDNVIYTLPLDGVPYPLGSGPHTLHLHRWQASEDGGVRLLVDGTHAGEVTGIHLHVTDHRIGIIDLTPRGSATLYFDDVEIWTGNSWNAAFDSLLLDGFESGSEGRWNSASPTRPAVTEDAALTGSWGLSVDLDSENPRFLVDDSPAGLRRYNARFELHVRSIPIPSGTDFALLELAQEDGAPAGSSHVQVRLGRDAEGYRMQVLHQELGPDPQSLAATSWFPIADGRHVVELKWQAATLPDGDNGALALRLDGRPAGELSGLASGGEVVESVRFGANDAAPGTRGTFSLDGFESWVRSQPPILRDDFEHVFGAWINLATTDLEITQDAALEGDYGLEVVLDPGGETYLIDDSPTAEKRYKARFLLDLNSLTMAAGDVFHILAGASQDGAPVGQAHLQLRLKYSAGSYRLQARHRDVATGSVLATGWVPIAGGEHVVDLRWRAASSTTETNGELRFWIDGVQAGELFGLANGDDVVESIRFGAKGVDAGTSGIIYLDSFLSWR